MKLKMILIPFMVISSGLYAEESITLAQIDSEIGYTKETLSLRRKLIASSTRRIKALKDKYERIGLLNQRVDDYNYHASRILSHMIKALHPVFLNRRVKAKKFRSSLAKKKTVRSKIKVCILYKPKGLKFGRINISKSVKPDGTPVKAITLDIDKVIPKYVKIKVKKKNPDPRAKINALQKKIKEYSKPIELKAKTLESFCKKEIAKVTRKLKKKVEEKLKTRLLQLESALKQIEEKNNEHNLLH